MYGNIACKTLSSSTNDYPNPNPSMFLNAAADRWGQRQQDKTCKANEERDLETDATAKRYVSESMEVQINVNRLAAAYDLSSYMDATIHSSLSVLAPCSVHTIYAPR